MLELVNIFNYVYEVLKQIIIILEGLSVINFIYKFIQNKSQLNLSPSRRHDK